MKDWISLLQTLTWPGVILIVILIVNIMFYPQLRAFLDIIIKRVDSDSSLKIGKSGLILDEDLRDSDKISEEEKDKVATELTQKRKEDYIYEDWINAAYIAYSEKRYEVALHDLSQALQYAKTKEQVAKALFNQGFVLGELGRFEEALQVYKQVDERYGKDTESGVRKQVAKALFSQGFVLGELGSFEEMLQVYKQVDVRYGKETEPGVREPVASALFNQGVAFAQMGRFEEEIRVYKQVDARYGKDTEPGVRESVANALFNQGAVLWKMDRSEDAIVALRKAEVIYAALGISKDEQKVRKLIAAIEKEKTNK